MTVLSGGYVGARTCTGGPRNGPKGGMAWYIGAYREEKGTNLGIYNCRAVRGGFITSLHGEGRAADFGTPVTNDWSWELAELLRMNSAELGIQCIIHRRRIWSSSYPDGWRPYTGVAAHFDHLHVEWTHDASNRSLADTVSLWLAILSDPSPIKADAAVIPAPRPSTPDVPTWVEIPMGGVSRRGTKGEQVRRDQADLIDTGFGVGPTGADSYWGENAVAAARTFQQAAGIVVDGEFGPQSREFIHKVPSWRNQGAREFQQALKNRGWNIKVDDEWGPKSKATLTAFQKEKGLVADGLYGPISWTALHTRTRASRG